MAGEAAHKDSMDLLKAVYDQVGKDFIPNKAGVLLPKDGASDPMSLHFFHPPFLVGQWGALRESVIVEGELTRRDKEVLASFVSKANECVFCTHTHVMFAESHGNDSAELRIALMEKNPDLISDARRAGIAKWSVQSQKMDACFDEKIPFSKEELPEILGTTLFFNYINRVVDTYLTRDEYIPSTPGIMKFFMKISSAFKRHMESKLVKRFGQCGRITTPGESLLKVDHKPILPDEFAWAKANTSIAEALALFDWSADDLAKVYIPENITQFVGSYIKNNYKGDKPPLSRKWAFTATEALHGTDKEKLAASFMLLVSFCPLQINKKLKRDVRAAFPDTKQYRAFGLWTAYQTAKRISNIQNTNYNSK